MCWPFDGKMHLPVMFRLKRPAALPLIQSERKCSTPLPLNVSIGLQAVSADCDISSYELQPTFSECLDFFEGDPFEDTRQSKKQKVCRHLSARHTSTLGWISGQQAIQQDIQQDIQLSHTFWPPGLLDMECTVTHAKPGCLSTSQTLHLQL